MNLDIKPKDTMTDGELIRELCQIIQKLSNRIDDKDIEIKRLQRNLEDRDNAIRRMRSNDIKGTLNALYGKSATAGYVDTDSVGDVRDTIHAF